MKRESNKVKINVMHYEFTITNIGDDIYVEHTQNNIWVLGIYDAKNKLWHIQENLDDGDIIYVKENIKNMAEVLLNMCWHIHGHTV